MNYVKKAMIMAAGVGSRLDPLTKELPKPLVPITNKPVMDILLENLSSIGITKVIANTYYHADKIIDRYSNNNFGIDFSYITEQDLSGTAGGLKKCQYFFDKGETFVVLSGDGLTNADIQKGIKLHKNSNAIATIGIKKIAKSELSKFGVVVTDENGFITEFQEKPKIDDAKSDFINTGIYIFDYKIFDYIPEKTFYDFAKNVFPKLVKEHAINTFEISEYWSDIGTLEQYIQSTKDVIDGICHVNENNLNLSDMPDSTKIEGYNVIGKNCTISKSAKLNNCIIWDNVEIAANTTISNSVIGNNSKIFCDVTDKIIGPNEVVENLAVNI